MSNTNQNKTFRLEEYKLLREEILFYMNKDTALLTCLFTAVTAILFFAFDSGIPEGCLLCFLIIIPIGSKFSYHQKQMAKISAYMNYYLEPYIEIKWETFISKVSSCKNRPKTSRWLKFSECLMMSIASVFSYIYLAYDKQLWEQNIYVFVIEIVIIISLFVWTLFIIKNIYSIKHYRDSFEKIIDDIQLFGGEQ